MRISLSPVEFRTPTAANPDTKTQEGLFCDVLLCLQGARPRARARHAACWLLGALEEAVRTCAHAVRGARERRKRRILL